MHCEGCFQRPAGCWKAREFGCTNQYRDARRTAAAEGFCPIGRWHSQPGAIYLPGVKTIVYTLARSIDRHPRVTALLDGYGFQDWSFFYGAPSSPYWAQIPHDHAAILRAHEPPLLILEDDIAPRDFQPWVVPPIGAQLVYLGAGKSRRGSGLGNARRILKRQRINQAHQYGWENIDRTWMRVYSMLYTHAILYVDRRAMLEVADAISSTGWQIDVTLARRQWRWFCACRKIPMFWQNDGRHKDETWDYAPTENEANYPPSAFPNESRAQRLRRERQQILGTWKPQPPAAPLPACRITTAPDGTWQRCTQ